MRNAMLKGAAALFAATFGVTVWAEDSTYQQSTDANGTDVHIHSDADAASGADLSAEVQAPSTQPADETHLNDHAGETSLGADGALDAGDTSVDGSMSSDGTAADGTVGNDNLSGSGEIHTDHAGQTGATLNDDPNDLSPAAAGADGDMDGEIRVRSDVNGDGVIDSADDASASGSIDVDGDRSLDADASIDTDAQPAAERMDRDSSTYDSADTGDTTGRSSADDGASMNDNPSDSSPADDQAVQENQSSEQR